MKKVLCLVLALLAILMLAACGQQGEDGAADPGEAISVDSLKTFGDILALEAEEAQYGYSEDCLAYAFKAGDAYYRATANLSADTSAALWDIDILAEDAEEKFSEIVGPLEIDQLENLNDQMLTREEMDALVGKTGQELWDDGWSSSGHDLETMQFWLNYGPFLYTVTFDGEVGEDQWDSFDDIEDTKELTVKSVEFLALGDATMIE